MALYISARLQEASLDNTRLVIDENREFVPPSVNQFCDWLVTYAESIQGEMSRWRRQMFLFSAMTLSREVADGHFSIHHIFDRLLSQVAPIDSDHTIRTKITESFNGYSRMYAMPWLIMTEDVQEHVQEDIEGQGEPDQEGQEGEHMG